MPADDTHNDQDHACGRALGHRRNLAFAAGLLALGGAVGAVAVAQTRPPIAMAPAAPVAIRSLPSRGIVTIRGRVAEIYGNKFILADGSGRALVDTGREGDDRQLVTASEPVTVQGRFDRGFVHAAFLVGSDNKVVMIEPLSGPPHRPHGRRASDDGSDDGRDGGPDAPPPLPGADRPGNAPPAPPPPPAAANGAAPAAPAAAPASR